MKHVTLLTVTVIIAVLALASPATADVPQMINYQGRLTNSSGAPFDTTVSITFTIYDDSTGGAAKWSETHPSVSVDSGGFSIILGAGSPPMPIEDTVFNQPDRYLGIKVGSDPELTPRTRLVSVPYSHRVSTVDGATGGTISGDVSIQSDLTISGKATIGPGHTNSGQMAFVAGEENKTSGQHPTVSGGYMNEAAGDFATVGGGVNNTAKHRGATVAGGDNNKAELDASTVCGGGDNSAKKNGSTVAGGIGNTADGYFAVVAGGTSNQANGQGSIACGGSMNVAGGTYSFAAGWGAQANNDGTFVWSGSDGSSFGSTGNCQFLIDATGGVGIGTTNPKRQLTVQGDILQNSATGTMLCLIAPTSGGSGALGTYDANGNYNVLLGTPVGYADRGWVAAVDASNVDQAGIYVDAAGDGIVYGDTKSFRMVNPSQPGTDIWYTCPEGPEAAAYVRGTSRLVHGKAEIAFPDHFTTVISPEGITVQLTPLSAESKGLAVVDKSADRIVVAELGNGDGSYDFDYVVMAVRKGYEDYQVIRPAMRMESPSSLELKQGQ